MLFTTWIRDLIKSEPSKWLPIAFSLLAVLISCLSWWEAHRARTLAQDVNRPVLQFDRISCEVQSALRPGETDTVVHVRVKNVGKATASLDKSDIVFLLPKNLENCTLSAGFGADYVGGLDGNEILVGFSYTLTEYVSASSGCQKFSSLGVGFLIDVEYSDASGASYSQRLRESAQIPLKLPAPR